MLETENEVKLVAFADDGKTVEYNIEKVTTTENYDFRAPEWDGDLTAVQQGEDILLSWDEAWDESGIYGYRVYADGQPVYRREGDYFNHVNDNYTTEDTSYLISSLDLNESHTFRVEAADAWWKALDGSGSTDYGVT
ncbi:MAG: hypothetical protein LUD07_12065 [Clostridiales bacterium]|nr:hypothetical protein [Clostridiales bacterium]